MLKFAVVLPEPKYLALKRELATEQQQSRFTYSYPDGDGDCNCVTWLERLGLPLLSGSMNEFTGLPGFRQYPRRRFGKCQ